MKSFASCTAASLEVNLGVQRIPRKTITTIWVIPPTERVWFGRCSKLGKNICPWPSSIYRKSGVAQMIFFSDCPKVSLLPKQKDFENQRVNHLDSHVLDKTHQCQSLKEMKETSQMGKSLLERSAFYGPLPVRRRYTHKLHLSLQVPAQLEDGHE